MANIRLRSTSIVQASNSKLESTQKKIELTSSDLKLLLVETIQKGLLFNKPKQPESKISDKTSLIQHLKNSLSRTLDFFTPLSGRLAKVEHDDNTASFFIDCNNSGAQFVDAVADNVTISDILEPIYVPPIVHSFFPLNGIKNCDVSQPLLAVQVTELADGIFIGCTINHLVADGTIFWNFINSWSEISRGLNQISKPPVFDHWFRGASFCPIRLPLSIIKMDNAISTTPPSQRQERVFHFSKENIAVLKQKANSESGCEKISSLQSVLAHLWQSFIHNQQIIDANDEMTNFHLQIGIRYRLQPTITEEYFGNAVQVGTISLKTREVIKHGIGYIALQMNKMIGCFTEDKIRNNIEGWTKNPKLIKAGIGGFSKNDLIVSSSPRFNVYGNDFGWGKPIAVRSGPGNKFVQKITVFPGAAEGSIDIEVSIFPDEILKAMGNDSLFMNAVTI